MIEEQFNIPIVFIIFNRPDTTRKVFEQIRQVKPKELYIISDGPRLGNASDATKCKESRGIVENIDWDCKVYKNYSEKNLGCQKRISSGLNWVFDNTESAIILEDDCLPHKSFFYYCKEMLEEYKDDSRVMMIGGTNYLLDQFKLEESYIFSRYYAIWGWATWRRAWEKYDESMQNWPKQKNQKQINYMYTQPFMRKSISAMFDEAYENKVNSWGIRWFYTCLFNNGLCIIPKENLISNIGTEGLHTTGIDTSNNNFPVFEFKYKEISHPKMVSPNINYDNQFFELKIKKSFRKKIIIYRNAILRKLFRKK